MRGFSVEAPAHVVEVAGTWRSRLAGPLREPLVAATSSGSSRRRASAGIRAAAVQEPRLAPLDGIDRSSVLVYDDEGLPLTPARIMNRRLKRLHTLEELCDFVHAEASRFCAQNVAHAYSRLAKFSSNTSSHSHSRLAGTPHRPPQPSLLSAAVSRLAAELPRTLDSFEARDAALCLWALSLMGSFEPEPFHALCLRSSQLAVEMNSADCTMVMLAFGRFQRMYPDLLQQIPQTLFLCLDTTKPHELSSVLWGFARLGPSCAPHKPFMQAVSRRLREDIHNYGGQELALSLWSMASLGYRPEQSVLRAAEQHLLAIAPHLSSQDVGNSLWALGRMRYRATDLLNALPMHLVGRLQDFQPQELSCLLFGYTHTRHLSPHLLGAAAPVLIQKSAQMSEQDAIIALWAYGIFAHPHPEHTSQGMEGHAADHSLPITNASRWQQQQQQQQTAVVTGAGQQHASGAWRESGLDRTASWPSAGNGSSTAQGQHASWATAASGEHSSPERSPGSHRDGSHAHSNSSGSSSSSSSGVQKPVGWQAAPQGSDAPDMLQGPEALRERAASSLGASTSAAPAAPSNGSSSSSSSSGVEEMVHACIRVVRAGNVANLRPVALGNLVKALASLRASGADVSAVVTAAAKAAVAKAPDFQPAEVANLLYGLSLMRYTDLQVYYTFVVQLIRKMEVNADGPFALNHKVLNSVVHSCISVGYTPWVLIECAEVRGIRVSGNSTTLTPRWQEGPPGFRARSMAAPWLLRHGRAAQAPMSPPAGMGSGPGEGGSSGMAPGAGGVANSIGGLESAAVAVGVHAAGQQVPFASSHAQADVLLRAPVPHHLQASQQQQQQQQLDLAALAQRQQLQRQQPQAQAQGQASAPAPGQPHSLTQGQGSVERPQMPQSPQAPSPTAHARVGSSLVARPVPLPRPGSRGTIRRPGSAPQVAVAPTLRIKHVGAPGGAPGQPGLGSAAGVIPMGAPRAAQGEAAGSSHDLGQAGAGVGAGGITIRAGQLQVQVPVGSGLSSNGASISGSAGGGALGSANGAVGVGSGQKLTATRPAWVQSAAADGQV